MKVGRWHFPIPVSMSSPFVSRPAVKFAHSHYLVHFLAQYVYTLKARWPLRLTVTESAILELLKAGKEAELHDLHTNWAIESD